MPLRHRRRSRQRRAVTGAEQRARSTWSGAPPPAPPVPPPAQPQTSDPDRGDGRWNAASRLPSVPGDTIVDSQVGGASWTNPVRDDHQAVEPNLDSMGRQLAGRPVDETAGMAVQLPSQQPAAQLPTQQPAMQLPSPQQAVQLPSPQPVAQLPIQQPAVQLPTQQSAVQLPSPQQAVQLPAQQPDPKAVSEANPLREAAEQPVGDGRGLRE